MQNFSDDQFARFKLQSDQAFQQMESRANSNMAEFLRKYGSDSPSVKNSTVSGFFDSSFFPEALQQQSRAAAAQAVAPIRAALANTQMPEMAELAAMADVNQEQLSDSVNDLKRDFRQFSESIQTDSRDMARDAVRGTKDILSREAFDLGQRAKQEAAALKAAAKAAMEEERTLKGLKGRASEEMRKMRERLTVHMEETKEEVLDDLQQMATGKLNKLKGRVGDLFESGQGSLEREWNDLKTGQDS